VFDGITPPLKYADITGEAGGRIDLYKNHPALCTSANEAECKGKAYLVPGNVVAVANTCGEYAHVQFIGEKQISYGWVDLNRLQSRSISTITNNDKTTPKTDSIESAGRNYLFKLTKGAGTPVCEAFLQRLNTTKYLRPPSCGIPENDSIPGFSKLNRVMLTKDEVERLWSHVLWFTRIQNEAAGDSPGWPSSMALAFALEVWWPGDTNQN
jgi:hypothetical protein